ncbi:hypothetical protein AV530_013662 [Patagioenas fasciata monilis]|uniref:Uncharacterized protein n=1 Tax=Patagioenas fasciata monilis TaxID=372326 RepID=A0A1V4J7B1_PATFA|nr:hypothetical protein AV530_013662 [Patagioenas fasciata monilis]
MERNILGSAPESCNRHLRFQCGSTSITEPCLEGSASSPALQGNCSCLQSLHPHGKWMQREIRGEHRNSRVVLQLQGDV